MRAHVPTSRRALLAALLAALVAVAGCTGIPNSSRPQVVRTVERGGNPEESQPNITPEAGAGPREIVSDFLSAGGQADAGHSTSRQFLTSVASRKWQDNTVIVVDETVVGVPTESGTRARVEVTGHRAGQLDAAGVFSPTLKGNGFGDTETFSFGLALTAGQWRIDQLAPGVLISQSTFAQAYRPRKLFFFDPSETTLVPDLRYTALTGQSLATWLLDQLLAGPRPELGQSVRNEVPDQVGEPSVTDGDPIVVEMPGTAQLDATGRNGLAAQLAYTLSPVQFAPAQLQLTDSNRAVRIPAADGRTFGVDDFPTVAPDAVASSTPYFVYGGAIINGTDGVALSGPLGTPAARLESIAVRHTTAGALQVAGISGGLLRIGSSTKLDPVTLPTGPLSRPEWRPHANDVWVGVGTHGGIYRIGTDLRARPVSITSPVVGSVPGQVLALRFSSDGVRMAAVLRTPDGSKSLWVGSVVTSGADVRIDSFEPLTPARLAVTDVAWADSSKLLMIGFGSSNETNVWQVQSDGSQLDPITSVGLPGVPTSIAAAPTRTPLVSAQNSIWTERGDSWVAFPKETARGTNPIFAS